MDSYQESVYGLFNDIKINPELEEIIKIGFSTFK